MHKLINHFEALLQNQIIRDIDLEFCHFLLDLKEDLADEVLIAAMLVSHLYRQGDVCLQLEKFAGRDLFEDTDTGTKISAPLLDDWEKALQKSEVVGYPGDFRPLVLDDAGRLYQHRLWQYEHTLADHLIQRGQKTIEDIDTSLLKDGLERLFNFTGSETDWQAVSATTSIRNKLSIISGGPGTGKTSTVVRVLALLLEQAAKKNQSLDIALAAPTGKAAARLQDSILSAKEKLNIEDDIRRSIPEQAITLHQLLGARRNTSKFRHNKENPIPYDVVIVDEASMVDQALMSKLVTALLKDTRLILLGDKDQLASVEAGSVMGDICSIDKNQVSREQAEWLKSLSHDVPEALISDNIKPLSDNITLLTKSYRFKEESGIGKLAEFINNSDVDGALGVLNADDYGDVLLETIENHSNLESFLESKFVRYFRTVRDSNSPREAMKRLGDFRILSAHRRGPLGVRYLNRLAEQILNEHHLIPKYQQWYAGKPIIINVNDYSLDLHNGDIGLCYPDSEGNPTVYFRKESEMKTVAPGRLPEHEPAYALTVHKSQGSEFEELALVLPDKRSKVMSRELIYTAITRARKSLTILGNTDVLRHCIRKKMERSSGLRDRLWE